MHHLLNSLAAFFIDNSGVLFLDVVLKATLLLLLAGGASVLLRRRSAAFRHRVWCLAFCGLLLLPALTTLLPSWRLPILPQPVESTATTDAESAGPIAEPLVRDSASESVAVTDTLTNPSEWDAGHPFDSHVTQMPWETLQPSRTFAALPPPIVIDPPAEDGLLPPLNLESELVADDAAVVPWGTIICSLWLLGAGLAVWPLLTGFARNLALYRMARTFDEPAAAEWIQNLCASLGLRRRVRLLETGRAIVPMTWGILRPIVLFPVAWREWTHKRRRLVLLHELAHVKRCDVGFQLIARLACALYWFHPLAWYALRRLRIERELACDDCVLMTGARPSEYAQELLEIARSYQSLALPTTVAMAQTTNLERRIRALLDRARPHLPLSRTAGMLLLIGSALLITGVAVVRPSTRAAVVESDVDRPTSETASDASADNSDPPTTLLAQTDAVSREASQSDAKGAAKPQAAADDLPTDEDLTLNYRGRVVDPAGEPVAGAKLFFVYWVHGQQPRHDVEPQAVTDADGRFDFTATRADIASNADSFYAGSFSFPLVAIAEGYGFVEQSSFVFETTGQAIERLPAKQRDFYEQRFKDAEPVFRLVKDDVPVRGRVVNTEGQPVQGAKVRIDRLWFNEEGSLDAWEAASREDQADFYSLRRHTPQAINGPQLSSVIPSVTTDADGRFTLRGIGRERVAQVLISGPGIESNLVKTRTREGETIQVPNEWRRERGPENQETYHPAEFTHVAAPSIPVVGNITDADTRKPIPGVTVTAGVMTTFLGGGKPWINAVTDADGRYRLDGLPIGVPERIAVLPEADAAYLPAGFRVTLTIDRNEAAHDVRLRKGIWVRGTTIDDRTKEPLSGGVRYFADVGNPHLERFEGFKRFSGVVYERRSDPRGQFAIAVPPGRGVITFMPDEAGNYRRGIGASTITMQAVDPNAETKFYATHPSYVVTTNHTILQEINPPVDSEPLEFTLAPTAGETVTGKVLDPNGAPISDGRVTVEGDAYQPAYYDEHQRAFRLEGYYPDQPREVFFFHVERNLAGHLRLEGEPAKDLAVKLQPAGSLRGRLVDDAGAPLAGVHLYGDGIPRDRYGYEDLRFVTDEDGRFLVRGLIPGRKYTVEARGDRLDGRVLIDETVDSPETKDVGDVTLQPPEERSVSASPAAARSAKKKSVSREATPSAAKRAAKPQAAAVTVTGKVLLPNGEAAAGAAVRAGVSMWAMLKPIVGEDYELPIIETTTDAEGSFTIDISTQPYGDLNRLDERWQEIWKETSIAASLPGYGGQWVRYKDIEGDGSITLKLVEDLPVRGRVIDLEGRPIAGVEVQIAGPSRAANEDLSAWIAAAEAGELPWTLGKHLAQQVKPGLIGVAGTVTTDEDGRFVIRGMGRERQFNVVIRHDALAYATAGIVTRDIEPFERVITTHGEFGNPTESVYGSRFTFTTQPSRPVVGTVRDAETGGPMPGVGVESYKFTDYPYSNHRVLKTVTDAEGRYRLTGMPKGDGNKIIILPNDEQPYLIQHADVPNPAGLGPATVDVGLHRGLWITGRVTDKITGEPVHSRLHYLPYRSNKYAQAVPEFDDNGNSQSDQMRYQTKPDGTYRLVGLPGPAIVGAESVHKQYRKGVGYDQMTGPKYRDTHYLDTYNNPVFPSPKWPNVMQEIDVAEGTESVVVDFELDPGQTVMISTLDADGQPLTGVKVTGAGSSSNSNKSIDAHRFEAANFSPGETRTMLFQKDDLGCVARISAGEAPADGVTVTLRPVATLTGRLLYEDGSPLTGANLRVWPLPSGDFAVRLPGGTTDRDGRFELTLLPGASYSMQAEGSGIDLGAEITRNLTVEPGKQKDLGDLRLVGRKFEPVANTDEVSVSREASPSALQGRAKPQAAVGARSDDRMTLRGRVTGPDGGPVDGARVWMAGPPRVSQNWSRNPQAVAWLELARSDEQGRFHATVDRARLEAPRESDQHVEIRLAATARGLGFGWADVKVSPLDNDITVQLVEDIPIEGRIFTVDGQPAVGVSVAVCHIPTSQANVDAIVKSASLSSGVYTNWPAWSGGSPETKPVTTDADGRFRLEGLGAGRVVRLEAHGGGIGATRLSIIMHPTPDELRPHGTIAVREGLRESQYFAEFTHIAQPGRTIRGAVTDAQTGKPTTGVRVTAMQSWASRKHPSVTGPDGRYEIIGVPKGDERYGYDYSLEFRIDDATHFNRDMRIKDAPGQEPLELDVAMARGITLRGRIADAETHKPVTGTVIYNALYPNQTVIQMDNASVANPLSSTTVRDDGTYELCVLPGPGAIAASIDGGPYLSATVDPDRLKELVDARGFEMIAQGDFRNLMPAAGGRSRGIMSLSRMQAAALLNPAEGDESLTIDLQVIRGRTLTGTILDDDGQPLTGVRVIGLGPSGADSSGPLETAEFTVEGLAAGRQRTLLFVHPDRKLGARLVIAGDETTPLTVKLSPTGSVTGRFVDKLGGPLPVVDVSLSIDLGFSSLGTHLWASVDEDGRFRVDGLIADCDYNIRGQIPEQPVSLYVPTEINLRPGETRDLGVFVQKDEYRFVPVDPTDGTQSKHLRGRVTGPNGDPVANAQIWLQRHSGNESEWLPLAKSSRGGWWSAASEHTRFDATLTENPDATVRLAATADGFGLAWTDVNIAALEELITLTLVEDVPIEGRILTIDGQPAARVKVTASELKQPTQPPLDDFIESLRAGAVHSRTYPYPGLWGKELPGQSLVVTDAEGRFRIAGLGADRTVSLLLEGEGLHHWSVLVVTQQPPRNSNRGLIAAAEEGGQDVYSASFEHIAQPGRTLRGVVLDAESGTPIEGAKVWSWGLTKAEPTSDADGRFELPGCRKVDEYQVTVVPSDGLHFTRMFTVPDEVGIGPIELSFELQRGIPANGRVTDADTGDPVVGEVHYYPLQGNQPAREAGIVPMAPPYASTIEEDGGYRIPVFPGPGVIGVKAFGKGYASATLDFAKYKQLVNSPQAHKQAEERGWLTSAWGPGPQIEYYEALALINPGPESDSLERDVTVAVGTTRRGRILDPDGRPANGVRISGLTTPSHRFTHEPLETNEFAVTGLRPGESRSLVFYHRERRLGAQLIVTGIEDDPLNVHLQPCGAVSGRIVDRSGEPVPDVMVEFSRTVPFVVIGTATWTALTDDRGRFEMPGLIAGLEYQLISHFRNQRGRSLSVKRVTVESGQTEDLGDIQMRE